MIALLVGLAAAAPATPAAPEAASAEAPAAAAAPEAASAEAPEAAVAPEAASAEAPAAPAAPGLPDSLPTGDPEVAGTQTFRVEVVAEPLKWAPELTVRVYDSAEDPLVLLLAPDPVRASYYTVEAELPARRWRDVELLLDGETSLWRRVVPAERPDALTVSFLVERTGPRATRVAWLPIVGSGPNAGNEVSLLLAFGWGGLVFAYVAWLARRAPA